MEASSIALSPSSFPSPRKGLMDAAAKKVVYVANVLKPSYSLRLPPFFPFFLVTWGAQITTS